MTVSGCVFERNAGESMIFAYNDDAMVDDMVFVVNSVEVSTIVMYIIIYIYIYFREATVLTG